MTYEVAHLLFGFWISNFGHFYWRATNKKLLLIDGGSLKTNIIIFIVFFIFCKTELHHLCRVSNGSSRQLISARITALIATSWWCSRGARQNPPPRCQIPAKISPNQPNIDTCHTYEQAFPKYGQSSL